jgi:transcriptional regulator of acetoin/glycerol metabolism
MNILDLIPGGRIGLALAVAAVAAAMYAGHIIDVKIHERRADAAGYTRGKGEVQTQWDAAEKIRAETAAKAEAAARVEEQRRIAAQQEILHANQLAVDRARADAASASDAAGRLRQRIADVLAGASSRQAAGNSAPATVGPAGTDAAGMFANVLGQCTERVQRLAEIADTARIAGAACVGAYDALTPPAEPPAP